MYFSIHNSTAYFYITTTIREFHSVIVISVYCHHFFSFYSLLNGAQILQWDQELVSFALLCSGSGWNMLSKILATERLRNGYWTSIYHIHTLWSLNDGLSLNLLETFVKPPRRFPNFFISRFFFRNFVLIKKRLPGKFPNNPSLMEAFF